jgi:hypothetical protein
VDSRAAGDDSDQIEVSSHGRVDSRRLAISAGVLKLGILAQRDRGQFFSEILNAPGAKKGIAGSGIRLLVASIDEIRPGMSAELMQHVREENRPI